MKYVTVLIYLIYVIWLPFLIAEQLTIKNMIILSVLFLLIFSVSYYWVFVTVHHAKYLFGQAGYLRWYVILIVFGLISSSASISLQILNHYQPSIMEYDVDWVGALFVLSFLGALLLAAIALVRMEKTALNKEGSVFGAWILLIYLPLGVFHIDKQLKKIKNHHAITKT